MIKSTFGDHLKREREMRGVSLEEISAATRIATRFLQAIENEQWDRLPGGVFNRGFVRAVARYLGLDEENIVAEFAAAVGDRPSVPVWTGSPPAITPDRPWLVWILVAIVALVLAAGGWFGVRRIFAWQASRRTSQISLASSAPPPVPTARPSAAETFPSFAESVPTPNPDSPPLPRGPHSPLASAAVSVSPSAALPIKLKVEAGKATLVTIEADAYRVFDGTMKAGQDYTFTARDKFQVSTPDAGALLLELDGKILAPIGPSGQEGKTTLTRKSLKGPGGGGN